MATVFMLPTGSLATALNGDDNANFTIDSSTGVMTRTGTLTPNSSYKVVYLSYDTVTGIIRGKSDVINALANTLALSGTPGPAYVGTAYTFTPTTQYANGTVTYSLSGTLPAGLSFSSTNGAITGTPTATASFTGTISATDSGGNTATLSISITVAAQAPAPPNAYNWNPNVQLARIKSSVADVKAGKPGTRCGIAVIGDSTSAGYASQTTTPGQGDPNTNARKNSWPYVMADVLNAAGINAIRQSYTSNGGMGNGDSRITFLSNTSMGGPNGFGGQFITQSAAGGGFDFLTDSGSGNFDRLDIYYLDPGDPFTIAVNGGTTQTVTPAAVNGSIRKTALTVPSFSGGAKINARYPTNTTTPFGHSIVPWLSTGAAVEVYNGGIAGYTAQAYSDTSQNGSGNLGLSQAILLAPRAGIVALGINDANGNRAVADFQSDITKIVTALQAAGIDVILVVETPTQEGGAVATAFGTAASPGPYTLALRAVADNKNVPLVDLNAYYGSYTALNNKGWMYNSLHGNKYLHADEANYFANIIKSL